MYFWRFCIYSSQSVRYAPSRVSPVVECVLWMNEPRSVSPRSSLSVRMPFWVHICPYTINCGSIVLHERTGLEFCQKSSIVAMWLRRASSCIILDLFQYISKTSAYGFSWPSRLINHNLFLQYFHPKQTAHESSDSLRDFLCTSTGIRVDKVSTRTRRPGVDTNCTPSVIETKAWHYKFCT